VIVEPVLGSSGILPLPTDYLRSLAALAEEHGALLIVDEIITFRR
jgi:4-aminobutyrate aminotransferase-like enzyme